MAKKPKEKKSTASKPNPFDLKYTIKRAMVGDLGITPNFMSPFSDKEGSQELCSRWKTCSCKVEGYSKERENSRN